jgi:histidinol dehydrogenase
MPNPRQEPAPFFDHRADREAGSVVYPVYSRRSGGLSIGVNLFPDRKRCSFDCPYCEVFPFRTNLRFSVDAMERGLRGAVAAAGDEAVKDFCFSGNGEPTLSSDFPDALRTAARLRDELRPDASLVVITNGSALGEPALSDLLAAAAQPRESGGWGLDIWLKVDAGTEAWYRKIDRSLVPFDPLRSWIAAFAARSPVTVQTMLCAVDGAGPDGAEEAAWIAFVLGLCLSGNGRDSGVRRVHLYGKARPAPEDPAAEQLPAAVLEARAAALRASLADAGLMGVAVSVFD